MTVETETPGEVIGELIDDSIEKVETVEAQIAVAKAEALVERAADTVAVIEQTAQIQVAQIAMEAEAQIAEHEEKVENLEYDLKWQHETIKSLQNSMDQILTKLEHLESNQSTPTLSNQTDQGMPETVVIQESVGVDDQQAPPENLVAEAFEAVAEVPQKVVRKIRAL